MISTQKVNKSEYRGFAGQAQAVFAEFNAAKSAASALVVNRRPKLHEVAALGINAKSFARVRFE
jgi:hypothetical protein